MDFSNKIVWITGASSGIGKALALELSNKNARLILSSRKQSDLESVKSSCKRPENVKIVTLDLEKLDTLEAKTNEAVQAFGTVDILVNNAGGGPPVAAADASPELTQKIIALNLTAPVILSQQAHPALMASEQVASVINIASVSGARPSPGTAAYGAAKAGLLNVTKSLAMEWGPDIRVNALIVGLVHNDAGVEHYGGEAGFQRVADMLPLKRMAAPTDIANAVLMLCSDRSSYISGANLEVDGGGEVPVFLHLANEQSTTK